MQSIDPTTGEAPADPLAGFLPPDNSSLQGEGFVIFTVKPKSGLANGTVINNQATIVFDANAAISTNTVTNTIDSANPTSSVAPLPATTNSASFTVSWSGSDPSGAGIATYDIFSATDTGPYTNWLSATTQTSATFTGTFGHTYSFYSMATDNAGQRQQTPGPIQQTTTVPPVTVSSVTVNPSAAASGGTVTLTVQLSGAAPSGGVSVGLTSSNQTTVPVPTTLNVSAGQTSASTLIQSGSVTSATTVTITATLYGSTQQTQLTILPPKQTPTVNASPSSSSITVVQPLQVTVMVSGGTGSATPTGSVILTGGGYTSSSTPLSGGSATITIPAGSLALGSDTFTVSSRRIRIVRRRTTARVAQPR